MDRETAEDIKRHFDVVGESLRSDIRTVAEGFVSPNERLDRIELAMSETHSIAIQETPSVSPTS